MISPLRHSTGKLKAADLAGQRFGLLLVVSLHHHARGQYYWNVKCDCGNDHITSTVLLGRGVKSCGCLKHKRSSRYKHGHSHTSTGKPSPTYKSWLGMMARCYTSSTKRYKDWGGRGIKVCERWHEFKNFLDDMGEKPEGYRISIERIDNDGDYELSNCKWATPKEQGLNKRPYRRLHARVCAICKSDFMAVMPWAMYCSDNCHNEATKRQQRAKKGKL